MAVIALKCPEINVTVVDSNSKKIEAWNGPIDKIPVYEPGLEKIIKKTRNKNLFSSDIQKLKISEIIFICKHSHKKKARELEWLQI